MLTYGTVYKLLFMLRFMYVRAYVHEHVDGPVHVHGTFYCACSRTFYMFMSMFLAIYHAHVHIDAQCSLTCSCSCLCRQGHQHFSTHCLEFDAKIYETKKFRSE